MNWDQVFTIVAILGGFGAWLWSRLDRKFDAQDKKFDSLCAHLAEMKSDVKDIQNDIKELRTSLNRMEGAFYAKECCMLQDERQLKKAE